MMRASLLSMALFNSLLALMMALMPPQTGVWEGLVPALTAALCLFGGLIPERLIVKQKAPE